MGPSLSHTLLLVLSCLGPTPITTTPCSERHTRSAESTDPECDVLEITTPRSYIYLYLEDYGLYYSAEGYVVFLVKARNDVHVTLSTRKGDWLKDSYEILIGGWYNTRSAIRACHQCNPVVQTDHTPLDNNFFMPFWVSWSANEIRVGQGTELSSKEFLRWEDPGPLSVNYIGISTGWGAEGHWIFGVVNGAWSAWSSWEDCSASCGGGTQSRTRACDDPKPSYGNDCEGDYLQTEECSQEICPIHGNWSSWSAWSACSTTCGQGQQQRSRTCDNPVPQFGGDDCPEPAIEFVNCDEGQCPVDGDWSSWQEWSACSQTCGAGSQDRGRSCTSPPPQHGGQPCSGGDRQAQNCFIRSCAVNGDWTHWGTWGACSLTCGQGQTTRTRRCDNPPPLNGGRPCPGEDTDLDICMNFECPVDGDWSSWSTWSACSLSCGYGIQERGRRCDSPAPQHNGSYCYGPESEMKPCLEDSCSINGGWSSWSAWSNCSTLCGEGYQTRRRNCDSPPPREGGQHCSGPAEDTRGCPQQYCPVSGGWSPWGRWANCSRTCGTGVATRYRECNNPPPAYEGATCAGPSKETTACQVNSCPVSGGWSSWALWTDCSTSCGTGQSTRQRACDDPPPENSGENCSGMATDMRDCHNGPCPVDGSWSVWTWWSPCSRTCGNGTRSRARWCAAPMPQVGGQLCQLDGVVIDSGMDVELESCLEKYCPINGSWTPWGPWGKCSRSCEGGMSERYRNCTFPAPQHGGLDCVGPAWENTTCNPDDCPQLIVWALWSSWSDCTMSCDGGYRHRTRECVGFELDPFSNYTCPGSSQQNISCNMDQCPIQIWMTDDREPTEAPEAQAIATIQFIILGIVMALFVFLDTFTVYDNLKYAWENVQDFVLTCREYHDRRKKKAVGADGVVVAFAAGEDSESEQKKPLYDGDGGGVGGGSTSTGTPLSQKRLGSDSDHASGSGSVNTTPRPSASERRRMRSMSTSSEASIPGAIIPKRKHKKPPKPKERSKMSIGILAIRKRVEPVKKKKKKRPRLRPLLKRTSSAHDSESSRRPSGIQEDIVEEDPKAMALYNMSSLEEGSSATGSIVAPVELRSKPPPRKTSDKGAKKGKKKSLKRKSTSVKGKVRGKKSNTGRNKSIKQSKKLKSVKSVSDEENSYDSETDLELGASAAQLYAERNRSVHEPASVESGHTSSHSDQYKHNPEIQQNLDLVDGDEKTIRAKTIRERFAHIRRRKKKMISIDKKYLIENSRSNHAKVLNIPSTIPETDVYNSRRRGMGNSTGLDIDSNCAYDDVLFEEKYSLLSRVSHGVKRRLHDLKFPGCAQPVVMSDEPVMLHPPTDISGSYVSNIDHPDGTAAAEMHGPATKGRNFTRQFLDMEFSDSANMNEEVPVISAKDVQKMYKIKLRGEELHFHRGYLPPSSRYLNTLRISSRQGFGSHGRVPLKSWETAGIINPELMKNKISLAAEGSRTLSATTGLDKYGLDIDLTMAERIVDEYPWQLKPEDRELADERLDGSSLENNENILFPEASVLPKDNPKLFKFQPDRMSDAKYHQEKTTTRKHGMPEDLEQKFAVDALGEPPMELSSPSGTSSDESTRQLISISQRGAPFWTRLPGAAIIQRFISPRHGEHMCYNVEEGHLETDDEPVCPHPSRIATTLGQALPTLRSRFRRNRSGSKDTLDIPDSDHDRTQHNRLWKLFFPCQNKRYSLDDMCVETIANDMQDNREGLSPEMEPEYENTSSSNRAFMWTLGDDESDFSSYYRAPLPKY